MEFVYLVESITGINSELFNLLSVFWVGVVGISVGPQPQLGVRVEAMA